MQTGGGEWGWGVRETFENEPKYMKYHPEKKVHHRTHLTWNNLIVNSINSQSIPRRLSSWSGWSCVPSAFCWRLPLPPPELWLDKDITQSGVGWGWGGGGRGPAEVAGGPGWTGQRASADLWNTPGWWEDPAQRPPPGRRTINLRLGSFFRSRISHNIRDRWSLARHHSFTIQISDSTIGKLLLCLANGG